MSTFLRRHWQMDDALVRAGFPATSPWWREQVERFVRAGRRRWIVRVGRRGGKSTTLCRLAVAHALFGSWSVPPGDTAVVPFVSVSKDEAQARLRTIAEILKALGIKHDQRGDELELVGSRRVVFRTLACTTSAVVGFTSVAIFGDEVAKWESRDVSANPAAEVIASLSPTMATQPAAFMVLCSSPWSQDDYHAEQFDAGDNDHQIVSFAPTWVANPTISEARTHELEPDERVWAREYAAEPGVMVSSALDPVDVAACFRGEVAGNAGPGFVCIDASSLRGDAFAWIAGRETSLGHLGVCEAGAWEGEEQRHVSMDQIVAELAKVCARYGTRVVFADQREEASLRALFSQRGITLRSWAWSDRSKDEAVMALRRLMREGRLGIVEHTKLRRELTGLKARLMPSGRTKYLTNGQDYASCLVTLAHAVVDHAVLTSMLQFESPATFRGGWSTAGDWFGND